jgi:Ferritin-like domain
MCGNFSASTSARFPVLLEAAKGDSLKDVITEDQTTRLNTPVSRRKILTLAAGVTGAAIAGSRVTSAFAADNTSGDTPTQIATAALIAEDLATTFYYNGLVGPVIQDPNLAGKNGTATQVAQNPRKSNFGNVDYLRAALQEEIDHANLLRTLAAYAGPGSDPYQTFYFPTGTFDNLSSFLAILDALENAFIGAYLAAVKEFAQMAADAGSGTSNAALFESLAQVAASIMGVEAEHRVLGRVIGNLNPANNYCYEQQDNIATVYNAPTSGTKISAVQALTPFLSSGSGKTGYSLATALANASSVAVPCTGGPPS